MAAAAASNTNGFAMNISPALPKQLMPSVSGHGAAIITIHETTVVAVVTHPHVHKHECPVLTSEQATEIIRSVLIGGKSMKSAFSRSQCGDKAGQERSPLVQVSVFIRDCNSPNGGHYVTGWNRDAIDAGIQLSQAKAFTAASLSTNHSAMSSRSLGSQTQDNGSQWNIGNMSMPTRNAGICEIPGGYPLYAWDPSRKCAHLIGGVGVAGDSPANDSALAMIGTKGYEAPDTIRIDKVSGGAVPY